MLAVPIPPRLLKRGIAGSRCAAMQRRALHMENWKAATGNNWMTPMLNDESKSGPNCTPEGWC